MQNSVDLHFSYGMSLICCQIEIRMRKLCIYLPFKAVDYVCKRAINKFIKGPIADWVDLKAVLKCKLTGLVLLP